MKLRDKFIIAICTVIIVYSIAYGAGLNIGDFTISQGDINVIDDTPHVLYWDSDSNEGYMWHVEFGAGGAPWQNFQLWRVNGTSTTPTVNPNKPLMWFDANNDAHFYNDLTAPGTLTADGLTLGADKNITLGPATIQYDTAEADIDVDEDINIKGTDPHLRLAPTAGDAYEWYAYGNEVWLTNYTDGLAYMRWMSDHTLQIWDGSPEIAGAVTHTEIKHFTASFDPGAWYDSDTELFAFEVGDDMPNGIIIDEWKVSCNVDPDVEMDLDLKYADDWINLANPVLIDVLDTTNGLSSEDTDANINSGNPVPNGKCVYFSFGADPEGTATQLHIDMWCHSY